MQDHVKKHYFIACGQVAWRRSADSDTLQIVPANSVAAFDEPFIRQFNLAQINASLVNNVGSLIGEEIDPTLVAGVTIMSISSLGYMTEEQFRAQPNGAVLAQEIRGQMDAAEAAEAAAANQAERA